MFKLAWLGTGVTRLVSMGLIAVLIVIAAIGAWNSFVKNPYKESGRQEVTTKINKQNAELDNKVDATNQNVIKEVTHETQVIEKHSKEIEYVIRNAPVQNMADVTRKRLDVVYEQQRPVREASQKSK